MGQFWTKKNDQEDEDEKTVNPFTERIGHGDRRFPDPNQSDK